MVFIKKIFKHKLLTGIILILIIGGGYFGYKNLVKKGGEIRYTLAAVKKGTIVVSVSGSGQISASDQVDIKSKVKSDVVSVYAAKDDEVKGGKLIVRLDDTDLKKAVSDAEIAFDSAQLELEELLSPPDELALLKAENAVLQAKNSLEKLKINQEKEYQKALETIQEAEEDIERAYEDTLNAVTNVFGDLPTIITGARNILYSYEIAESEKTITAYQQNRDVYRNLIIGDERYELEPFVKSAEESYKTARENYDQNFKNYKTAGYLSEKKVIEDLLNETTETVKSIAQAVKDETNIIDFVIDYLSRRNSRIYKKITDYQSDLKTYTSKTNSFYSNLLSIQRSLRDSKEAKVKAEESLAEMKKTHPLDLEAAEVSLREKEKSLTDLKADPDELTIRTKKNSLRQKEDTLILARQNLADCNIFVPFDGIITEIKVKKGDSVSSGAIVASLITKQKIAKLTLNEIDAVKVKVGQKATLTFDALPEVTIIGKVVEVDTVGTVSQGVVSYGVKIALDTDDERIKPSVSVTADIIVDAKTDVLVSPNSAVKFQGGVYYVELVEIPEEKKQEFLNNRTGVILPTQPKQQRIEVGISSDALTEIVSGLKEGDIVVSSTISQTQTTQIQRTQQFQIPGMGPQIRMR